MEKSKERAAQQSRSLNPSLYSWHCTKDRAAICSVVVILCDLNTVGETQTAPRLLNKG